MKDEFILRGSCRYAVKLSKEREVLAVVDTKTEEEVKVSKEELYEYAQFINIIDKPRKIAEIDAFKGDFIPLYRSAELFESAYNPCVVCVSEKEVVCDGTYNFYILLYQDKHIFRCIKHSAEVALFTQRPLDISGVFCTLGIGWDDGDCMDFTSNIYAHGIKTSKVVSKGYKNQNWKLNKVQIEGSCNIDGWTSMKLSMKNTIIRNNKNQNTTWVTLNSRDAKVNIKDCDIQPTMALCSDILQANIENTSIDELLIGSQYREEETPLVKSSKTVEIKNSGIKQLSSYLRNVHLTLDADITHLIIEVSCFEDFDTDWVLNIHKPIEVVTVNAPTSIHNKPKMLKFLEELRQKARYVNVE